MRAYILYMSGGLRGGRCLEKFFEDGERLQLGKVGQVEAVVGVDVAEQAAALGSVEAKDVHVFVAHAQEHGDELCLGVGDEVGVRRQRGYEASCAQVEKFESFGRFDIGCDA